jgi:hypothetical protein
VSVVSRGLIVGGLAAGGMAVGCGDPPAAPFELAVRVVSEHVWSGAEALLILPQGPALSASPTVRLADSLLAVRWVDDTTLAVRLPDRPGSHHLLVETPNDSTLVGPLRLYGYHGYFEGRPLKGVLRIWPGGGVPLVLAAGERGLVHYNVRANVATVWSDSIHSSGCNWGVGASFRPNHVVLQARGADGACGPLRTWRLYPSLQPREPGYDPGPNWWGVAELSDGVWITTEDDLYRLADCRSGVCQVTTTWYGGATDPVISPRGDRVALDGGYPSQSPWVLDPQSGLELYRLRRLDVGFASAFTREGDTLFVVGQDSASRTLVLAAVRAADGEELGSVALDTLDDGGWTTPGLALDPEASWLYVASVSGSAQIPTLLVIDRGSLAVLAILRAPAPVGPYWDYIGKGLWVVPAPLEGYVYVIRAQYHYDPPKPPSLVFRFERLPGPAPDG